MNNEEKYKIIGLNIKKFRESNGLTQAKFSELLGVSVSYISKIEAPKCNKSFSLDLLFQISNVLNINIKELFNEI